MGELYFMHDLVECHVFLFEELNYSSFKGVQFDYVKGKGGLMIYGKDSIFVLIQGNWIMILDPDESNSRE